MTIIVFIVSILLALFGQQHDQIAVNYYGNCAIIVNNVDSVAQFSQDDNDLYLIHLDQHDDHTFIIVISSLDHYASYEITPSGIVWVDF